MITVEELAESFRLDVDWLDKLGVTNESGRVRIDYGEGTRSRYRHHLRDDQGERFKWASADEEPYPIRAYGTAFDINDPTSTDLVLVEGESDSWVLWLADINAIGIPGATLVALLHSGDLKGFERIYISHEPDDNAYPLPIAAVGGHGEQQGRSQVGDS